MKKFLILFLMAAMMTAVLCSCSSESSTAGDSAPKSSNDVNILYEVDDGDVPSGVGQAEVVGIVVTLRDESDKAVELKPNAIGCENLSKDLTYTMNVRPKQMGGSQMAVFNADSILFEYDAGLIEIVRCNPDDRYDTNFTLKNISGVDSTTITIKASGEYEREVTLKFN